MGTITVCNQTTPTTPASGKTRIFVDSADKHPKIVDDTGLVSDLLDGSGTVTSITQGTGITATPNPITTTGTIAIASTGVTPGSYQSVDLTVNAQGQLTAVSDGTGSFAENTITTTDATITTLATIPLTDDTLYIVEARIIGRRTDAPDRAGYHRKVVAYREGGGSATLQGAVQTTLTRESDTSWACSFTVSGNDLLLQVLGAVGKTVNWKSSHIELQVA